MVGLVAVVPVRGLRGSKTRLSEIFSEDERIGLTCAMLRHVLGVLVGTRVVERVAVVTPDADVGAAFPEPSGRIELVRQSTGQAGLNPALIVGRDWALDRGAAAMLAISSDLPLLEEADIEDIAALDAAVVLAPDRHGAGTNALLLRISEPSTEQFTFAFGQQSAARHIAEAERLGLPMEMSVPGGTAFDLDTPDDWQALPSHVRASLAPVRGDVEEAVPCP